MPTNYTNTAHNVGNNNTIRRIKMPRSTNKQTPEAREKELTALAMDLAEKQLREGTASPSVITHFLKLGDTTERKIEMELKSNQARLLSAKAESIIKEEDDISIAKSAEAAFKKYNGGK